MSDDLNSFINRWMQEQRRIQRAIGAPYKDINDQIKRIAESVPKIDINMQAITSMLGAMEAYKRLISVNFPNLNSITEQLSRALVINASYVRNLELQMSILSAVDAFLAKRPELAERAVPINQEKSVIGIISELKEEITDLRDEIVEMKEEGEKKSRTDRYFAILLWILGIIIPMLLSNNDNNDDHNNQHQMELHTNISTIMEQYYNLDSGVKTEPDNGDFNGGMQS